MWNEIQTVFYALLDRPPSDRSRYLAALTGVPDTVRGAVERLLRLSETGDNFLEPPEPPTSLKSAQSVRDADQWIGKLLGPFRVLSHIADGGMGSVFIAERADGLFQQRVAVKTLGLGSMTAARRGYFDRERRALAQLEHPYITRLIDGGASDEGIPYLVMELAEGRAIDEHCEEQSLTLPERVRLFVRVCEAVQFAHQNLIVHADLKPRNILVGPGGAPKLLDFGVAKLLTADVGIAAGASSRGSVRPLSPWYASPELRRGDHATVASDVFSLGVILSELLVSHRSIVAPLGPSKPPGAQPARDASARSTGASTHADSSVGPRATPDFKRLRSGGDLEAIVAKATAREPSQRYGSAQHLADDLQHYLARRPVAARRPTARYRVVRFIGRNLAASALGLLVTLSLIGGVIGTAAGLRRAERQRDVAVRATQFIETLLSSSNPYKDGSEPSILDVLADTSSRIDEELAGEPEVEAEVRFAIARTYGGLWQWSEAKPHAERAMELTRKLPHIRGADLADRLLLFGTVLTWNHDDRAESIQREVVAIRERLFGRNHPQSAEANVHLAFAVWHTPVDGGRWAEAEALFREAIAVLRGHRDTRSRQLAMATYSLSAMLMTKGDHDGDAGALAEESIALFRASGELSDRYFAEALRNYSYTLRRRERWAEEAAAIEEFLFRTPVSFSLGATALASRWRLHELHRTLNDPDQAERWFREYILAECRLRAAYHRDDVTSAWHELAARVSASDDTPVATPTLQAVVSELRKGSCTDDLVIIQRIAQYGRARCDAGDLELASNLSEAAQPKSSQETTAESVAAAVFEGMYGACLLRADRLEEAKPLLISSANRLRGALPLTDPVRRVTIERMVRLYERTGEDGKAEVYRRMLVQPQ